MSDLMAEIDEIIESAPDTSPEMDAFQQVEELLNPTEESAVEEPVRDDETSEEPLEAEPEAEMQDGIDYSVEVPMSDGSKVKLGELKDHYQDAQRHVLELQERENAVMAKYNEVNELAQYTQLPPQQLETIRRQQQDYLQQEHQKMLAAIPELADQAQFVKVKEGIYNLAAEYGITDLVSQVTDHRVVKMLNDFSKLRNSIKAAKDNVKPLRSKEPKASNKAGGKADAATNAINRAKETGRTGDQIAAINALLQ